MVFLPFLSLLQPYLETFFTGYNASLMDYFLSHFVVIFGLEFLVVATISIIASALAIRRYAKV